MPLSSRSHPSRPLITGALALLLAITLLPLWPATPGGAQAEGSVTIRPEGSQHTATRSGRAVVVDGHLPVGAQISRAALVAHEADGRTAEQNVSDTIGQPEDANASWMQVRADGSVDGRLVLNCLFAEPSPGCPFPHDDIRTVTLRLDLVGGTSLTSAPLAVDPTQPVIVHYVVVAPDTIVVRFSEPVRLAGGTTLPPTDLAADFTSPDGISILQASNSDCGSVTAACATRRLRTSTIAEDHRPEIRYVPAANRPKYEDGAGNQARIGSTTNAWSQALDAVRPAVPRIDAIAGVTPTSARAVITERSPQVRVSNVTSGHELRAVVDGVTDVAATMTATGTTATLQLSALTGPDADRNSIVVSVVATDPNGNASTDTGAEGARADGQPNPVTIDVDGRVPVPVSAVRFDSTTVDVMFSEAVTPDTAGTWRLGTRAPTSVTAIRAGTARRLTFAAPVSFSETLSWQPGSTGFVDRAGRPVAAFTGLSLGDPLPLPTPRVTTPAGPLITAQRAVSLGGVADGANSLDLLLADASSPDDEAAAQTVGQTTVASGSWAISTTLPDADGTYLHKVRSRSDLGGQSSLVNVPAIILDRQAPVVEISAPAPRPGPLGVGQQPPAYAVGDTIDVVFSITEDRLAGAHVTFTPEGGQPQTIGDIAEPGAGSRQIALSPDAPAGQAVIAVEAVDQAGNTGRDEVTIVIDPDLLPVRQTALTRNGLGRAEAVLTFDGDLAGSTLPFDWRANDGDIDAGAKDRRPLQVRVDGPTVTLVFATPFPGPGHGNAAPLVTYESSVGDLRGADGRRLSVVDRVITDVTPPVVVQAPGVPAGPVNLEGDRLVLTGRTDAASAAKPNTVTARVRVGDGPQLTAVSVQAAADGAFAVPVHVPPDATSTITLTVIDPAGNRAPEQALTLIEDSDPPGLTELTATSTVEGVATIRYTADEPARLVELDHRVGDGPWTPISAAPPSSTSATQGEVTWRQPADVAGKPVTIRAIATDLAGNRDPASARLTMLGAGVDLVSARAIGPRRVEVVVTRPVTSTQADAAGFSVLDGGPGVRGSTADGTTILLELNRDLDVATPTIRYSGLGGWRAADAQELRPGQVVAARAFLFGVTGLAGRPDGEQGASLSWVDDRNQPAWIDRYEIVRDAAVITTVPRTARGVTDPSVPTGARTYTVTPIGSDGLRGEAHSVRVVIGMGESLAELAGGTGFPDGSVVLEDCPAPAEPNLSSSGGTALSCDGRVAVLLPPGAVTGPAFAAIIRRSVVRTDGFTPLGQTYQIVAVDAASGAVIDRFEQYAELSIRDSSGLLSAAEAGRVAWLRSYGLGRIDELATRVGSESATVSILTLGSFVLAEAQGISLRIDGRDPAVAADRFATAVGLSQTQFRQAGAAVLARADDYPDALAASTVAADIGGPVLLSSTSSVSHTALLELRRLGATRVVLVGGPAALSEDVAAQLAAAGHTIERIAGETRVETAASVAATSGSRDGTFHLATGDGFADALAAASPAALLGRPILLTRRDSLPGATAETLTALGASHVHIVGGEAAVSTTVEAQLTALGLAVTRSSGATRFETAAVLADELIRTGAMRGDRIVVASGVGDGRTSPDALSAGPVAGRLVGPLLLTGRGEAHPTVLRFAVDARSGLIAGGPAAISPRARAQVDAAGD